MHIFIKKKLQFTRKSFIQNNTDDLIKKSILTGCTIFDHCLMHGLDIRVRRAYRGKILKRFKEFIKQYIFIDIITFQENPRRLVL